jgi:hypothetical protein
MPENSHLSSDPQIARILRGSWGMASIFVSAQERRIMFQAMSNGLRLDCGIEESAQMIAFGWTRVEKKDLAGVSVKIGKGLAAMVKSFQENSVEKSKDDTPLLDAVLDAFGERGGAASLSALEYGAFAVPTKRVVQWIAAKEFDRRLADIFELAAKAAGAIQGQVGRD